MSLFHNISELGGQAETLHPYGAYSWLSKGPGDKKKIQVAGLGDVGSSLLIGLRLMGADVLKSIGIYDLDLNRCLRWEMELNQIRQAFSEEEGPEVSILLEEELFACDIFVFCIARSVPAVGQEDKDVRLVQLEANGRIVASYARKAAERGFKGLFVVVSDPVDLLCRVALNATQDMEHPLHPNQIQGCGLGVMNARAMYYARKYIAFGQYLTEGRAFGPHGDKLVIANSLNPGHYRAELSDELTRITRTANLQMRQVGYKPYVAPALSSGALTILQIIRGEWNYSANYLNGVYFGARNRTTSQGIEWELADLPAELWEKLQDAYNWLKAYEEYKDY